MKNSFVKWGVAVLLLLIMIGLVWFFYNNHERTFSVRDMVGEEVVAEPDGNFFSRMVEMEGGDTF